MVRPGFSYYSRCAGSMAGQRQQCAATVMNSAKYLVSLAVTPREPARRAFIADGALTAPATISTQQDGHRNGDDALPISGP